MAVKSTSVPRLVIEPRRIPPSGLRQGAPRVRRRPPVAAIATAAGLLVAGIVWVTLTHTQPSYDAFGWLTWGRQVLLHWNLNTDGAPSWKPLTFLFTLPYAAFGAAQISLWTVTASTAAIAAAVFAARIAYRLTGSMAAPQPARWPAIVAGAFAGLGVLGMNGLSHQVLIATSDPMVVTLCLAAVDAHLSGRPRLTFALIILASLGRPEAWPFAVLYAAWSWRKLPDTPRAELMVGLLLIPAAWFVIPALTSRSWFISGQLALNFPGAIHGNKVLGVFNRLRGLYELPMQLAVFAAILLAFVRRDRVALALAGAAALWVIVEIAFAYHGWPASQRYLMEAGAIFVVLTGAAVGRALNFAVRGARGALLPAGASYDRRGTQRLQVAALVGVTALVIALVPVALSRARLLHSEVNKAAFFAVRIHHLATTVGLLGGPAQVKACGKPVTFVGNQSTLAWNIDTNVSGVGYVPGREIRSDKPIVLFASIGSGWQVTPVHTAPALLASCQHLALAYGVGPTGRTPSATVTPSLPSALFGAADPRGNRR